MKLTIRRLALLACSVALNAFFVLSPMATQTVQAARCQEEVNASLAACQENCDYLYENGSEDWHSCTDSCADGWVHSSMSAVCCGDSYYQYCWLSAWYTYECHYSYTGNCLP